MPYKGSSYDAAPMFESNGVPHGSADLVNAVPDYHKKFLERLVWVYEENNVWIDSEKGRICCKLIAVHVGLVKSKPVDEQLKVLWERDTSVSKVEDLSGSYVLIKSKFDSPSFLEKFGNMRMSICQETLDNNASWDVVTTTDLREHKLTEEGGDSGEDNYVLVNREDITEGVASFMAAYLSSLEQTKVRGFLIVPKSGLSFLFGIQKQGFIQVKRAVLNLCHDHKCFATIN